MKRCTVYIALGLSLLFLLVACNSKTSTSFGLTVQKTVLASANDKGQVVPSKDNVFTRGDQIYFVLINVGKFKKGADGLNWFDMDTQITGPDGKVLLEKKNILGDEGHTALKDDIAQSPHITFATTKTMQPGKYKFKLTIYDKIGKGSASESATFTLK